MLSEDPAAMLDFVLGNNPLRPPCPSPPPSERKLRLFAVACCRHVWPLLADPRARRAVEAVEQHADGKRESLEVPWRDWRDGTRDVPDWLRYWSPCAASPAGAARRCRGHPPMAAAQAALLREIVGDPWRPVRLWRVTGAEPWSDRLGWVDARPWLTPTVMRIATGIYADRDFAALPVLADALEEGGCESEDLLAHLRGRERCPVCLGTGREPGSDQEERQSCGPATCYGTGWVCLRGPHALGCAALDAVLGKE